MDLYEKTHMNTKDYEKSLAVLNNQFGYPSFKPYQYEIIDRILKGEDVVAIMQTGYGKSACFQIPPVVSGELAIVVSPLISLMRDQRLSLDKIGIKSCCYNSTLTVKTKQKMEEDLKNGEYQLMYITPESLIKSSSLIDTIYEKQGICMVAIDEAHCISSYGFDFRMSYRELYTIRSYLINVPILAVTATATEKVIEDIKTVMKMDACSVIKTTFDRPNLCINVNIQSQQTQNKLVDIIRASTGSAIVYCITKNDTETIASFLVDHGISCGVYHAGLGNQLRDETQTKFMDGTYKCIAATIAFGMGINKLDVRTIVHLGCPQNIESYYQEIGRAGRDGKLSNCYLFFREKDFIIQQKFIEKITDDTYRKVRSLLLNVISKYVNLRSCRRKYVLSYFGENYDKETCGNCDNCIVGTKIAPIIELTDKTMLMHQVLATVIDMRSSFGRSSIELILKGSNSKKISPTMKQCQYYGAMKNMTSAQIKLIIHTLLDDKLLELYDIGNCMYILKLTPNGISFNSGIVEKKRLLYNVAAQVL